MRRETEEEGKGTEAGPRREVDWDQGRGRGNDSCGSVLTDDSRSKSPDKRGFTDVVTLANKN